MSICNQWLGDKFEHFRFGKSSYVLGSEAWEEQCSSGLLKYYVLSVWEERLYGENSNIHSQNDSGDVAGGDGELGCLCGKADTSHVMCGGSAHSSGCMVNGL